MALSNYDVDYVVDVMEPAFSGIETAIDQLDGIMMHAHNGDINFPTFDKAFLESVKKDLENTHNVLMCYETELKASKH